MEAECLALTEATQEAVWLCTLLEELKLPQTLPTPMQEDNQGTTNCSIGEPTVSPQVETLPTEATFHSRESS